ncbi:MAG TPA: hypothetical protein ENH94_03805 [Phycisphaerales bacterium]|nr:hypothetical protein [Phycisphaerales bacterium]
MANVSTDQRREGIVSSHSMILFRQGIEYLESSKFSEALACFEQVYKTDGQIPNLHYACAVAFMKLGRKEEAVLACQSEITKTPDHRDASALLNVIISQEELCWPENTYLVNHDHHFVYCPVPKVICSNMRKAILKVAGLHEQHGHDRSIHTCKVHGDIYKCAKKELGFNTNVGTAQQILNDNRYFKFIIVRNPWSRLLSAYLDKFVISPHTGDKAMVKLIGQIRAEYYLSPDMDKTVTFRQFVEYEARKSDMEINEHWRPQSCFCGGHKFDFIAKFENIQDDINYINNKLGLNFDINFNKNTVGYRKDAAHQDKYFSDCYADELMAIRENCGGFPNYKQFYPPELKELVDRRYACDIEAFGYEF